MFSIEISVKVKLRKNNVGPHEGVTGSLVGWSIGWPPRIGLSVEEFLQKKESFLKENCFRNPRQSEAFLEFAINRRSVNHSWRPSLKDAPVLTFRRYFTLLSHFIITVTPLEWNFILTWTLHAVRKRPTNLLNNVCIQFITQAHENASFAVNIPCHFFLQLLPYST